MLGCSRLCAVNDPLRGTTPGLGRAPMEALRYIFKHFPLPGRIAIGSSNAIIYHMKQ